MLPLFRALIRYNASKDTFTPCAGIVVSYVSRAVQFHPHGGQFDFVWIPARTHHEAYVW